jgi:hypothetical protein
MSGNEQVRVEIETFLTALASYPDRVASDPEVTFEQHRVSLMRPASASGTQPRPMVKAARSNG